jgi:hypothetical protein
MRFRLSKANGSLNEEEKVNQLLKDVALINEAIEEDSSEAKVDSSLHMPSALEEALGMKSSKVRSVNPSDNRTNETKDKT